MNRRDLRFYGLLFGGIFVFFLALKLIVWPAE